MYRSPNIVRVSKSRRLIWVGHISRREKVRSRFKILKGKPTGKRPLVKPSLDGRTILEWILKKWVLKRGIELFRLRIGIGIIWGPL